MSISTGVKDSVKEVAKPPNLKNVFLDTSVKIEPLVDRWYAWPHLLSPIQQAMNLTFRSLPIARSFVSAPSAHIAAACDPALFGGPFLDLPLTAVEEVRQYILQTEYRRSTAIAFAREFREFDLALGASATGYSLDDFQKAMPESMQGLAELVYSLNNSPKIRLLEEMFLDHDLGHKGAQEILLHKQKDTERPFFLSTPRVLSGSGLFLPTPFGSDAAKMLCEARTQPVDLMELSKLLSVEVGDLESYFTNIPPNSRGSTYHDMANIRIRYFGHACVLIESSNFSILIDPTCAWSSDPETDNFCYYDFPQRIDLLILSHGHQDHLCAEALMQIRHRVDVVLIPPNNRGELADPSLKMMLNMLGFERIVTIDPLETFAIPDGVVTSLPFNGEHAGLDIQSKHCVLIQWRGKKICLFVDTDAIDPAVYERLQTRLYDIDVMFVGMECFGAPLSWLYGPLMSKPLSRQNDNSRRLSGANCERAFRLAEILRPKYAFVYAMGQEPWMRYLMGLNYKEDDIQLKESAAFLAKCNSLGINAERLYMKKEFVF